MTKREQTTIDPELIRALRADAAGAPGSAVRARVFARVEKHLAMLAAPVSAAVSTGIVTAESAASAPSAPPLPDVASPAAQSLLASALGKPIGIAVISAAVGGGGAYALSEYTQPNERAAEHRTSAPAPARPRPTAVIASASKPPAVETPAAVDTEPAARDRVVRRPSRETAARPSAAPARSARPSGASLGEQQALLDAARKSLARGESRAVLETLNAHSSRYPDSDLVEEREALAIKALVAAGRYQAARERGARFKQRFPNSLLAPSVTAALKAIP